MNNARLLSALAALTGVIAPAIAAPGGPIGTMPLGRYTCELPGDAASTAGQHVPEADFKVINASSYATPTGQGTYLLTGESLTMTGGPLRDWRFHRVSNGFLRKLEADGSEGKLRCVRGGISVAG
ncbi:MAG: elongation factor P [Novosphingobium sp.]